MYLYRLVGLHHDRVHYDFKVRLSDSKRKFKATCAYRDATRSTERALSSCIMSYSSANPQKRARIDENYHTVCAPRTPRDIFRTPPLQPLPTTVNVNSAVNFAGFIDGLTPVPKRRKITREVMQDDLARLGREHWAQEAADSEGLRTFAISSMDFLPISRFFALIL